MRVDRLPDAIIMEEDMEISDIIKTTFNGINNTTDAVKKNTKGTSDFKSYMTKTYSLDDVFNMAADKYGISRDLLKSVAMTESCFDETAVSYCGATGLMQLMPGTARSLGVDDSTDPVQNIMGGAKLLSQLLDKYDQNLSLALAGYNGGTGNVAKYNGVPPFCEGYVKKVTSYLNGNVTVPDKTVTIDLTTGTSSVNGDTATVSKVMTSNKASNRLQILQILQLTKQLLLQSIQEQLVQRYLYESEITIQGNQPLLQATRWLKPLEITLTT